VRSLFWKVQQTGKRRVVVVEESLLGERGFRHGKMCNVEHEASIADADGLEVAVAR
jgi:hypothetical protein